MRAFDRLSLPNVFLPSDRPFSRELTTLDLESLGSLRHRTGNRLVSSSRLSAQGSSSSTGALHSNRDSLLRATSTTSLFSFRSTMSKLPSPALYASPKAEVFYQTTSNMHVLSDTGIRTRPPASKVFKASLRSLDEMREDGDVSDDDVKEDADDGCGMAEPLPLEHATAGVLDRIFPTETQKEKDKKAEKPKTPQKVNRRKSRAATCCVGDMSKADAKEHHSHGFARSKSINLGASGMASSMASSKGSFATRQADPSSQLMLFRAKILQKMNTMRGTFEIYARSPTIANGHNDVSHQAFTKFMEDHFRTLDKSECDAVFHFLDAADSGGISVDEFNMACEASLAVKSIEDLRFKLVAYGYSTMQQVLNLMEATTRKTWEPYSLQRRLSLQEFAAALWTVGIDKEEEHTVLFSFLSQSHDDTSKVSLAELAAALAAIGPPLLLEDVRERLLGKFGSLCDAFKALDLNDEGEITMERWVEFAVERIKLTAHAASKAYRLIDIDGNQSVSRVEFLGALRLVEPGLFLEVLRKQVRQRWRSIQDAFIWHQVAVDSYDPAVVLRERSETDKQMLEQAQDGGEHFKSLDEFTFILSRVQMSERDTELLFSRIDIDGDGRLTTLEFVRGMRLFAPSCALEDLRLRALAKHGSVRRAFETVSPLRSKESLNSESFLKILDHLGLAADSNTEYIFDLVERVTGGLFITELVVALNAAAPGVHVLLSPDARDAKVHLEVKEQMDPFLTTMRDHRERVRKKLSSSRNTALPMGRISEPASYYCSSAQWQNEFGRPNSNKARKKLLRTVQSASAPTLPRAEAPVSSLDALCGPGLKPRTPEWSKRNHKKTMAALYNATPDPFRENIDEDFRDEVQEYFVTANKKLALDNSMLKQSPVSGFVQYKKMQKAAKLVS